MPRGGTRVGAGRRKGGRNQETIDKQAADAAYRAFVQTHHQRVWTAALEAACGSFALFDPDAAEDDDFLRWIRVEQLRDRWTG